VAQEASRVTFDEQAPSPIQRFRTRPLTRKESVLKQEIDAYFTSDVDNTSCLTVGRRLLPICHTLDLPDAVCEGLTYKQRLVHTERGDCLLLARWKPDRHMRRNAPDWSQRWFVEKQLFPPDVTRLFTRLERRLQEAEAAAEDEAPAAGSPTIDLSDLTGDEDPSRSDQSNSDESDSESDSDTE
jgi:hypothetical protein